MSTDNPTSKDDYDNPWKEMLEHAFPEFIQFYYSAYTEIDWNKGYTFK